jgi:hypothetical protein
MVGGLTKQPRQFVTSSAHNGVVRLSELNQETLVKTTLIPCTAVILWIQSCSSNHHLKTRMKWTHHTNVLSILCPKQSNGFILYLVLGVLCTRARSLGLSILWFLPPILIISIFLKGNCVTCRPNLSIFNMVNN